MRRVVTIVVGVLAMWWVMRQCRKPSGWLGRRVVRVMNLSHTWVTDWGLTDIPIGKADIILDVGCGGGRTIEKLALAAPEGRVSGIDYSKASVAAARVTNKAAIDAGRVDIQEASVSHLPFADRTFDLVTAVETHYYWPDLPADMREVLRVLKPGGRMLLIAEAYHGGRQGPLPRIAMTPMGGKVLSVSELRDLFSNAGFAGVDVREEFKKGWVRATGTRP